VYQANEPAVPPARFSRPAERTASLSTRSTSRPASRL
jgi:hypothetical protein